MRPYLFFFLVLMTCSALFAYEVKVTKLTDDKFDPLPKDIHVYYRESIEEYQSKSNYKSYKDTQIATITLIFKFIEIGKDYDAATTLARKEAAKLGADLIIYISHTIYKDTEDIASMTYRCVRTKYIDDIERVNKGIEANKNVNKELESSPFFKKLQDTLFPKFSDRINEKIQYRMLGVKWKTIKNRENQEKVIYFDIKTRRRISEKEVIERVVNHSVDQIILCYKENFELYKSEYDKIMQVMKEYPNSTLYFPKLDSKGNIDYEKMRGDLQLLLDN